MGLPKIPFFLLSLLLFFSSDFHFTSFAKAPPDYSTLVYKGCSNQDLSDPTGAYSQALSTVFGTLVSQSTKAKFFKTTAGGGGATVSGLFQCRGDLSNAECYDCASRIPILSDKMCGKKVAARIQLRGCYMLYEVAGFTQISGMELLYKTCGGGGKGSGGFEERRDTAISAVEGGVVSGGGNGFFATSYQSVYAMGQCEGDLGSSDCGDCVKGAFQKAQVECGGAPSAQIYLHKCFVSYSYYPNGVPKSSSSPFSPSSSGQSTGKTVAIILGGAAAVGFVVICLLFARGLAKKHDDF